MLNPSQRYFNRSVSQQADGRSFGQRTLEAVNRTGANITSYRELAGALVDAEDGSVLTITQSFEVPKTILITKNKITITCSGKGALLPGAPGLTLFKVKDVDDAFLYRVRVLRNSKNVSFENFVDFDYVETKKNFIIEECYVEADRFLKCSINLKSLGLSAIPISISESAGAFTGANYENWVGERSFIVKNTHRSYAEDEQDRRFIWGPGSGYGPLMAILWMTTITQNETTGWISFMGSGNIVTSNVILGRIDRLGTGLPVNYHSVAMYTRQNIVTDNICRNVTSVGGTTPVYSNATAGTTPPYAAGTFCIVANNLEINP